MQLYAGFFELEKKGIIELQVKRKKLVEDAIPVIEASINGRKVIYDAMDGFTWTRGSDEENLEYFKTNYNADFYFKRSYHKKLLQYKQPHCHVLPLGLNYNVHPSKNMFLLNQSYNDKIKYFAKTNGLLKKLFRKSFFYAKDFEYYPLEEKENKILFLTRVWNPEEGKTENSKIERAEINALRVACIKACRQTFGNLFTGGLFMDDFASKNYPDLAIPLNLTSKFSFVNLVKQHTICIATTGLHQSIGWKLGEYVAASRAIISEPLQFELPGNFEKNRHYFEFTNTDELVKQITYLREHKDVLLNTMHQNFLYYNNYVKPEILILNTLIAINNNEQ